MSDVNRLPPSRSTRHVLHQNGNSGCRPRAPFLYQPSPSNRLSLLFPPTTPSQGSIGQDFESPILLNEEREPLFGVVGGSMSGSPFARTPILSGDRFIPDRSFPSQQIFQTLQPSPSVGEAKVKARKRSRVRPVGPENAHAQEASSSFERVLRSELFESPFKRSRQNSADSTRSPFTNATNVPSGSPARLRSTSQPSTLFSFSSPARKTPLSRAQAGTILQDQAFNASPLSVETQNELSRPKSASRVVEQLPYAVLDAPYIQDDYYTQPLAWSSSQNILAVALGSSVYTWKPGKKQGEPREVACIRNYGYLGRNVVTSIRWVSDDTISVGTSKGFIDFVDVTRQQLVRRLSCHEARIGALDLSPSRILTSGSADKTIKHHDSRMPYSVASEVKVHKGQVCGLKWSSNGELASGGNDDKLFIMKGVATKPLYSLSHVHNAAVKALDWSPHQPHLLCSGGGARDGTIRFWSSRTGEEALDKVDIGSQICQVIWSRNSDEIVSSHGFGWNSPENRLFVWKINSSAPTTQCVASLSGHSYRVLHLALSPDGKSVVSGSGDETLRLWKVFPRVPKTQYKPRRSSLDPTSLIR